MTRILGGEDGLPDEWNKTVEMLRKTAETVLGVTFGKRKGDKETWWWNEEVQKSIKEKKEAKKAWDKIRDENTKKVYREKKNKAKKAVAMAKGRVYDDVYARLETKEGEKELYRLARQRNRAGKDIQHVRVIKDENGNVMVNSKAVLKRWKEYFEKLMNEENNREPRTEPANNAMEVPCGPCKGCPYGNRTDLAAGAAVALHGFTARVSCGSNHLCKKFFLKVI